MSQILTIYFVRPQLPTVEEGKAHMGRWMVWRNSLGDAFVHPATPCNDLKRLAPMASKMEVSQPLVF
ncbi:MAG: hypothetical protein RMX60_00655 [Planktomarina sp.]|nr:hypothetical protein [Planktomarina sp.]